MTVFLLKLINCLIYTGCISYPGLLYLPFCCFISIFSFLLFFFLSFDVLTFIVLSFSFIFPKYFRYFVPNAFTFAYIPCVILITTFKEILLCCFFLLFHIVDNWFLLKVLLFHPNFTGLWFCEVLALQGTGFLEFPSWFSLSTLYTGLSIFRTKIIFNYAISH